MFTILTLKQVLPINCLDSWIVYIYSMNLIDSAPKVKISTYIIIKQLKSKSNCLDFREA